ncbi:MAG: sulfotransferase domain-containing protein [Gammaproteobacteria bacterium]|nr:sulfotransferase domain-containing protein [Gammaproteobacteria bacterium]MCP4089842.1 sulfotransferase domain-containing protein [Gammaproteobacteria bacterium]MCP4275497.1 sulfotransferase domain-containing protein [Gammaproteobacteria bacterium]MCP4832989.1 sulfotransferase domain-containing protein [Gammaproteobacteria bacterium]MCP4928639.1 sulfotransferase domain-containing protein [Gammaproteobacteria bacterium]
MRTAQKPNFFIIGAPKCGTSSLINTLRWHPKIYVPLAFEPQYFCTDFPSIANYTPESYLRLFDAVTDEHKAVGEKSVIYLYSEVAVDNILKFDPNARFIVMLRNPIDLVYSWHSQLYYTFMEQIEDFKTAWYLQESRQKGEGIVPRCKVPFALQYREIGALGKYLQKLYTKVPREQVKIIFMEDLHADADKVYKETLKFLGVPYMPRRDARSLNTNKRHRFRWLGANLAHDSTSRVSRAFNKFEKLPVIQKTNLRYWLHEWNKIEYKREPLSSELRQMLTEEFRDDINNLAKLTDRDLAHWLP